MDSSRQPAREDAKRKREEETVEIPSTSKSPRLDVSSRAGRKSPKKSTKTQKATNSKKGKKQQASKVSADSESSLECSENQANFTESLQFVRKESRRCQVCSKSYDKVDEAYGCFLSHKNSFAKSKFRCYICFVIFKDTEMLFEHYRSEHSHPEGIEDALMCNLCDKKLAYKNVSAHMIASHAVPPIPENYNLKVNSENLEEKYKDEVTTTSKRRFKPLLASSNKKKFTKIATKNKKSDAEDVTILRELQELKYKYRQCQSCLKLYESFFRAECCFQSHGDTSLRCFFCVTTFPDTNALYEHYNNGPHEKGAKEQTIICKFCKKSVKYSCASAHIISMHLTKNEFE